MFRSGPTGVESARTPEGHLFTGAEIGDFLLRACHDLRTPVRAIRTHAELLAKSVESHPTTSNDPRLAFIVEGAGKLDRLVDGLTGYSIALQIDPGAFVLTPLGVLLRNVLARLDKELRDVQAEVTYGELPQVSGDPDRLIQLFENLLRHRVKARTQVHITASPHPEGWLFAFRDNGPAMEAADLKDLFRPFAFGLGLATCREIVERHGGRIWAESQADHCTFLFTLPAAQGATNS